MKAANDALRFLVELAMLAAIAYWGFHEHSSWLLKILLGIGGPSLVVVVWAIWMAPKSQRRASEGQRVALEILIFGLATAGLIGAGATAIGIAFGVVAAVNAVLDHVLAHQA